MDIIDHMAAAPGPTASLSRGARYIPIERFLDPPPPPPPINFEHDHFLFNFSGGPKIYYRTDPKAVLFR